MLGKLADRIVSGGYPAALTWPPGHRRQLWYRDCPDSIVQRDVRDLARISAMDALPRLLTLAAGQTARLLNVSDLAGDASADIARNLSNSRDLTFQSADT